MGEALRAAARRLATVSDTPRLDAELLLAHSLGVTREQLLLGDHAVPDHFAALIDRRAAGEPVAYITGGRAFWTIELEVGPGVLIPRPDSETLIEAVIAHFGEAAPERILDLGTGPGTLLLAALDQWPHATGLGVESSEAALGYARANADAIAPGRAAFRLGNWSEGIAERFDLIFCNPPYVADGEADPSTAHEPPEALFAGPDGLDAYRALAPLLPRLAHPDGLVALEIGASQREAVTAIMAPFGWDVTCRADLAGRDRALLLRPAGQTSS